MTARPALAPGPRRRRTVGAVVALVGWTAFLAGTAAILHGVGGTLAPPPLSQPGQLGQWLEQRQPAEAAFAVVRLLALGLAWYLLVITVACTVARAIGGASLVRAADAVSVPLVRRLVGGALGVTLAAATLTGGGGAALAEEHIGPPGPSAGTESMHRLPDGQPFATRPAAAPTTAAPAGSRTSPVPTMQRLPATAPTRASPTNQTSLATTTTAAAAGDAPAVAPVPAEAAPAVAPLPAGGRTWVVQPGDHFWAVAERVLAEVWGRAPADEEVDGYWRSLVDANAGQLRDPGNPDLLFPGQIIAVPAPPGASSAPPLRRPLAPDMP